MNLASSIILHPANECVVMYSMYAEEDCNGVPVTAARSFETVEDLKDYFPAHFKEGEVEDGELKVIRSIKHPIATSVEVFAEELFAGGSIISENIGDVLDRPDMACTTFRFENAVEDDNGNFTPQNNMP